MDKEWEAIRNKVLDRANNCCEACGVPNHTKIIRVTHTGKYPSTKVHDVAIYYPKKDYWEFKGARFLKYEAGLESLKSHLKVTGHESDFKVSRIHLRVNYVDHNPLHNALDNLIAYCPKHAAIHTVDTRNKTRKDKQYARWLQLEMPFMEDSSVSIMEIAKEAVGILRYFVDYEWNTKQNYPSSQDGDDYLSCVMCKAISFESPELIPHDVGCPLGLANKFLAKIDSENK